jgi:hypothetical protein
MKLPPIPFDRDFLRKWEGLFPGKTTRFPE